jgi:hypothetical protein
MEHLLIKYVEGSINKDLASEVGLRVIGLDVVRDPSRYWSSGRPSQRMRSETL